MVFICRDKGYWRKYVTAALTGLIGVWFILICATHCAAQPKDQHSDQLSAQKYYGAQAVTNGPSSTIVIEVEPSAQEVEAIAKQQADDSRMVGEPPDFWVAIFTMVLGCSTIGLWIATLKSAKAATRAAEIAERALVDLEAPSIFLEIEREFNEFTTSTPGTMGGGTVHISKIPTGWYFCFINFGRTPAFLLTVNGDVSAVNKEDGIPSMVKESDVRLPRGAVVPPGDRSKKFTVRLPIVTDNTKVFLGICCRFADIFNNEYLAGFSYFMTSEEVGFRLTDYKTGYNYLTLVKSGTEEKANKAATAATTHSAPP